ncbi:MAG: hypothetical protein ACWGHO_01650 [Candidatus Moraniibacteriota bacterium]|jgi:hypothetical protein
MAEILSDWDNFLKKSNNKKALPQSLRQKVLSEFIDLWNLLMHNEWPTELAAKICKSYPLYNVAHFLDEHVRKLAA